LIALYFNLKTNLTFLWGIPAEQDVHRIERWVFAGICRLLLEPEVL
jgi:hypothetical protein